MNIFSIKNKNTTETIGTILPLQEKIVFLDKIFLEANFLSLFEKISELEIKNILGETLSESAAFETLTYSHDMVKKYEITDLSSKVA